MSQDVGICSFLKGCTHLYICMKQLLICTYRRERFLLHKMDYILNILLFIIIIALIYCRMDIVKQCSIVMLISVFGCHTNAFILKCT